MMKNGRYSDAQIMGILKQAEGGTSVQNFKELRTYSQIDWARNLNDIEH